MTALLCIICFMFGVIAGGVYEAIRSQRVVKRYGKWVPYDF